MAAMTVHELMEDEGHTRAEAELIMAKRVFGDDVTFDKNGVPEEHGIGSPWSIRHHPTLNRNHFSNILKNEGADALARALAQAGLKTAP